MSAWTGDDLPTAAELRDDMRTRIADLTARLATAEARAELEVAARDMLRAEGERRATAAIVADLRAGGGLAPIVRWAASELADRYEAGNHLPSAGDAGEG